ncbi:MAG: transporter substrate-binding domain-containing protein [Thermodesulfobacteriota bacterium]|nr:transporter substrate-binding domain-containing protein [Thermodesulfobacteriota bacterium]
MKLFKCLMVAVLLSFILLPVSVVAAASMTIAVHDYPPFYNVEGKGMMIDVYTAACKAADIDVSFEVLPVKRAVAYLFQNKVDAFSPGQLFLSPEMNAQVTNVNTFNVVGIFLYYDPDNTKNVVFNEITDFQDKSILTTAHSPMLKYYEKLKIDHRVIPSPVNMVKMLHAGRADFMEGTLLSGMSLVHQMFKAQLTDFDYVLNKAAPCSVAFHNANPKGKTLAAQFEAGFNTIKANGEYIRILESYWGRNNIQKEALPLDMADYGVDKADFEVFGQYTRNAWGQIVE